MPRRAHLRHLPAVVGLQVMVLLAATATTGPASAREAQEGGAGPAGQDDDGGSEQPRPGSTDTSGIDGSAFILPIEATVLDVEATIGDLDGGTATTEATEEITVTLEADVFFDFDESDLRSDALDTLAEVATQIEEDGATEVRIDGHTDSVGGASYNQTLSEDRADAVETYLAEELDGVGFTTEGHGADQPVAPDETDDGEDFEEGRALNRRVEISYPRAD